MTPIAIGLSMQQQRTLSDMGIDVWLRRSAPAPDAQHAATASPTATPVSRKRSDSRDAVDAPPVALAQTQSPDAAVSEYRAELDCLAIVGAVLVGRWQNALDKRLANDIAIALGAVLATDSAMVQTAKAQQKVQQTAFRWPATQTGDASFAAARSAFKAFVRGQTERAQARCVVLFGDVAAALADEADSTVALPVLRQPAIGALRADPKAKKALWLNVSQNVHG
jgi:hypothetical protein